MCELDVCVYVDITLTITNRYVESKNKRFVEAQKNNCRIPHKVCRSLQRAAGESSELPRPSGGTHIRRGPPTGAPGGSTGERH